MLARLERARSVVAECAGLAGWALPDAEVLACLEAVTALVGQVAGVQARLVGLAEARGLPAGDAATSTVAWLRHRLRLSPPAARRVVELARAVDGSPRLASALAGGVVSAEQVAAIDACRAAIPAEAGGETVDRAEAMLVEWAGQFDPVALRRLGRRILAHVDPEFDERVQAAALRREQARAERDRQVYLSPLGGGRVRLSGVLDAEAAAVVNAALDPLCVPGPGDGRSAPQRRADALVEVCEFAVRGGELPDHGGERPQVVVTVDFGALRAGVGAGLLDTGDVVSPGQVRRMACDARVVPAVLGGAGQVLDLGRARRVVTGPLRRALILRDRGCSFPGCDRPPRWAEAHHVEHWVDGGVTSLANTALLCRHHHRAVHHGGWGVRVDPDGYPTFIPPPHVDPQRRPRRNHYHQPHPQQRRCP